MRQITQFSTDFIVTTMKYDVFQLPTRVYWMPTELDVANMSHMQQQRLLIRSHNIQSAIDEQTLYITNYALKVPLLLYAQFVPSVEYHRLLIS